MKESVTSQTINRGKLRLQGQEEGLKQYPLTLKLKILWTKNVRWKQL